MKLPTIFQLVFCSATLALAADDQPAKSIPEAVEWLEVRVNAADDHKLPRVLLVGDSITGGYFPGVVNELKGRANVARFASSRGLGDPALFEELALMLEQYQFSVIHFNNGLHGWAYTEDDYRAAFPKLLQLLKEHAPGAKLIWASTTPHRMGPPKFEQFDPKNKRIQERNRIAAELVAPVGIPVNDLYALEENHPEHMTDGCHYKPEVAAAQAKQVARFIAAALPATEKVVTVVADLSASRTPIPEDFLGLSFESSQLLPKPDGWHEFSPANRPLQNLLQTLGIRNLRFGGNLADSRTSPDPQPADIDPMFELARSVGGKVIYTVRFTKDGSRRPFVAADAAAAASACEHILAKYPDCLAAFTIGNEPNMYFGLLEKELAASNKVHLARYVMDRKAYERYWLEWRKYAQIITAETPAARFNGPSTSGNPAWAKWFGEDSARDRRIAFVSNHYYPGRDGKAGESDSKLESMLSPAWHQLYAKYLEGNGFTNLDGCPFRIEECNSFYAGGAPGVSDAFGSALWALDFAHWFATQGCAGINFHTSTASRQGAGFLFYTPFSRNSTNSASESIASGGSGYFLHPVGYAALMFKLGGNGRSVPIDVTNGILNLIAYAVAGRDGNLYVTLINKEYDAATRSAQVCFSPKGAKLNASGESLSLLAPDHDVRAKSGITLGGAPVAEDGTWAGKWQALPASAFTQDGMVSVTVPPASAMVLKLPVDVSK